MRRVALHAPSVRNDGSYVDAGEIVTIGTAPDQIDGARAQAMVDEGRAVAAAAGSKQVD